MAVPVGMAALIKALGPAFKMMMAGEAVNMARKYMFDGRSKGGKAFSQQMWNTISGQLDKMTDKDWARLLKNSGADGYKKKAGQWLAELVPSALGTGLGAMGSMSGLKHSIMADAIAKSIDSMVPQEMAA